MVKTTTEFQVDIMKESCYINPGSIGQQRDSQTDISFAICSLKDNILKVRIERHKYNSLKAYLKIRIFGCGINNANYLIRESWRKRLYEGVGYWCEWIHRKKYL